MNLHAVRRPPGRGEYLSLADFARAYVDMRDAPLRPNPWAEWLHAYARAEVNDRMFDISRRADRLRNAIAMAGGRDIGEVGLLVSHAEYRELQQRMTYFDLQTLTDGILRVHGIPVIPRG